MDAGTGYVQVRILLDEVVKSCKTHNARLEHDTHTQCENQYPCNNKIIGNLHLLLRVVHLAEQRIYLVVRKLLMKLGKRALVNLMICIKNVKIFLLGSDHISLKKKILRGLLRRYKLFDDSFCHVH